MNESHDSCSNLYECSCKDLDKLVEAARYAKHTLTCLNIFYKPCSDVDCYKIASTQSIMSTSI